MTGKMALVGFIVAALVISGLGIFAVTHDSKSTMSENEIEQYALSEAVAGETDEQVLLTAEQIETIRAEAQVLRDAHATRIQIRETVQNMTHACVQENLESYGLAPEEISAIQAKMTELMDKMLEIRETAYELRGQDMNRQDIREELQPLIDEAKAIRAELKGMLDQYGILPPEIQQPGMCGGCGEGDCQGQDRQGRFGRRP